MFIVRTRKRTVTVGIITIAVIGLVVAYLWADRQPADGTMTSTTTTTMVKTLRYGPAPGYPPTTDIEITSANAILTPRFEGANNYTLTLAVTWRNTSNSTLYYTYGCGTALEVLIQPTSTAKVEVVRTLLCTTAPITGEMKPGDEVTSIAPRGDYYIYVVSSGPRGGLTVDVQFTLYWWTDPLLVSDLHAFPSTGTFNVS